MAVTTTQKINSVYRQIAQDFPSIQFVNGSDFFWSSDIHSITHPAIDSLEDLYHLLHEIGHARLGHSHYPSDADLVNMEYSAWEYAVNTLSPLYNLGLNIEDEVVTSALDSYRQWLHNRSVCPNCQAIGVQESTDNYLCLVCRQKWRVNEARSCQLRRYKQ